MKANSPMLLTLSVTTLVFGSFTGLMISEHGKIAPSSNTCMYMGAGASTGGPPVPVGCVNPRTDACQEVCQSDQSGSSWLIWPIGKQKWDSGSEYSEYCQKREFLNDHCGWCVLNFNSD